MRSHLTQIPKFDSGKSRVCRHLIKRQIVIASWFWKDITTVKCIKMALKPRFATGWLYSYDQKTISKHNIAMLQLWIYTRGRFNMKMPSYQYMNSLCDDTTILRPYFSTYIPIQVRYLYIESGPDINLTWYIMQRHREAYVPCKYKESVRGHSVNSCFTLSDRFFLSQINP